MKSKRRWDSYNTNIPVTRLTGYLAQTTLTTLIQICVPGSCTSRSGQRSDTYLIVSLQRSLTTRVFYRFLRAFRASSAAVITSTDGAISSSEVITGCRIGPSSPLYIS
jgi:hypothetical protein